jgi:TonB-linked SusC/RagA family outer membrane protein
LEAIPVYNMEQALKGRASGVSVTQNSGTPGGRIEVRIRGGNSMIGSNEPLYVVDGFPVTGGINYLNPSDIESIEILKDASATAIYGARGANGVVLVTSKKGKRGQQGRIEINSYYGTQKEINRYEVLNAEQYAVVVNEWLENEGLPPYFDLDEIQGEGTNWQDATFSPAPIQNHTLTFSGGSEKTAYSLSGNFFDQKGIIFNSSATRGNLRINLDHEVNNLINLGLNLTVGRNERFSVPVDNAGFYGMAGYLAAPPTLPLYDENGLPTRIELAYHFASQDMRNPLIYDKPYKSRNLGNSVLGNASLDFKILDGLTFTTRAGLEYRTNMSEGFTPIIYEDDRGSASEGFSYTNSFLNENILNYKKEFNENHKIDVVGGFTYQSFLARFTNVSVSDLASNITENYDLGSAAIVNVPSNGISEWDLLSVLGRINYSIFDKYLITFSMRADGSSRFGADNKWGYFPSGAIGWRLSDEPFMDNVGFIDDLKLRASYGVTGNTALSPYQSLSRLITTTNNTRAVYDDTEVVGYAPGNVANPNLKWESTAQLDVGFDLSVMEGILSFTFDYYKKTTSDLLASVTLPTSSGFRSVLKNIGEIQNEGIEVSVNANVLRGEFKWDIMAQASSNKNTVTELAGGADIIGGSLPHPFNSPANIAREGEPFGSFYGLLEDGLTEEGLINYVDVNGDGEVNSLDRVILGDPNPRFFYGFTNNFSYKNFDLTVFIEGVEGREIFWATAGTHLNSFQRGHNQFADLFGNYWTAENPDPNAKYPKVSSVTNAQVSDRYVKDGSYMRIKDITLAYNFPVNNISWINKAQLYVAGTNLFTFTSYPGLDPEVNTLGTDSQNIGSRLLTGINQLAYPSAKMFRVGTRLNF